MNSSRERFRQLAILEIEPERFLAAKTALDNGEYLIKAADLADDIFWRQVLPDADLRSLLERIGDDEELKEMFLFHHGPYDRLGDDEPFLSVDPRLAGASFYPRDLTREEFTNYIRTHPGSKSDLESPYTLVRRTNSHLTAIPYHKAYWEFVGHLRDILAAASATERHPLFREFLAQRAQDLSTDDYYPSESLWVHLSDNPIDLVIGPYEVYEDRLMGLKAAYEAMVLERDFEETSKVLRLQRQLPSLVESLEPKLGKPLHIENTGIRTSVANLIYAGGDARTAIPAIGFTLPNDERVIEEVGRRQVILKNILEAKFRSVVWRILNSVLETPPVDEEAAMRHFYEHTLFHEIAHSAGPRRIVVNGEETTVNRSLRQYHSVLEETKADTLATCLRLNLAGADSRTVLETYMGGLLRSIRFGFAQAHGRANAIQLNYLLREGAVVDNRETGKLSINKSRAHNAIFNLASNILNIQEHGDFDAAQHFVAAFCVVSTAIEELLRRISDIPIDIRIRYRV